MSKYNSPNNLLLCFIHFVLKYFLLACSFEIIPAPHSPTNSNRYRNLPKSHDTEHQAKEFTQLFSHGLSSLSFPLHPDRVSGSPQDAKNPLFMNPWRIFPGLPRLGHGVSWTINLWIKHTTELLYNKEKEKEEECFRAEWTVFQHSMSINSTTQNFSQYPHAFSTQRTF